VEAEAKARRENETAMQAIAQQRLEMPFQREKREEERAINFNQIEARRMAIEERRVQLEEERARSAKWEREQAKEERKAALEERKAMVDVLSALTKKLG